MTYKLFRAALLSVAVMLSACVNTLELATPNERNNDYERVQAIYRAKEYFETHRNQLTRSADEEPTVEAPFVTGDVITDWESAITVADSEKRYTDFSMFKENRFFLLLNEDEEQVEAVELYSRFVSVEDFGLDTMNQYIATYIPDVEYLQSYNSVAQDDGGINCEDWHEFSGVVMYTMLSGHYVAAYRYEDGAIIERAFLYDKEKSMEENVTDFYSVMRNLTLGIAVAQEDTRVFLSEIIVEIEEIIICEDRRSSIIPDFDPLTLDDYTLVEPITNNFEGAGGGTESAGGGTESDDKEPTPEELAENLFKIDSLSQEQVKIIGDLLVEINKDCMGKELYNKLMEIFNNSGDSLTITFDSTTDNASGIGYTDSFNSGDTVSQNATIQLYDSTSDVLMHEMFHAYQLAMAGTGTKFGQATANYEIEAQLAKYFYGLRNGGTITLEEDHKLYNTEGHIWWHIANLSSYTNGVIIFRQEDYSKLYRFIVQQYISQDKVQYTYTQPENISKTISNLSALSKKCQ